MKNYVGFLLRLPPEVHKRMKELAERDIRSMHGEFLYALRLFVDSRCVYHVEKEKDDG